MTRIDAREALRYAVDREWLKLYGVFVLGWLLSGVGQLLANAFSFLLTSLLGVLFVFVGTAVGIIALVAGAYKLVAEASAAFTAEASNTTETTTAGADTTPTGTTAGADTTPTGTTETAEASTNTGEESTVTEGDDGASDDGDHR